MATLTALVTGVGEGAQGPPIFGGSTRVQQIRSYTFDFDNSYPTGGESISAIWNDLRTVNQIFVSTIANRIPVVDYSGKKLKLYTALGTEASDTSDQSSITGVKLTAIGYP